MRSKTRLVLWMMVVLGALVALKTAASRWQAESANRTVAIILDWDEVRLLSEVTNTPLTTVLNRFREQGAEGVAIGEDTLGELDGFQRIQVLPPRETASGLGEMVTRLDIPDDALRNRVRNVISRKWGQKVVRAKTVLTVRVAWTELYSLSVGLPEDVVVAVKAAGLQPVPRVTNFMAPDQFAVQWALESAKAQGAHLVIFGGDQVLGYPSLIKQTANSLTANGLLFGQVEFGKQKGEDELALGLNGSLVRVHSINPTEMARTTESDAVDRFLRAAEERNIRALYVRALPGAPWPALESNVRYVGAIAKALRSHGMVLGSPQPYVEYGSNTLERCLMGLGVGAATLLALLYAWPAVGGTLALVLLLALLDVILPISSSGSKIVALQGALLMPVLAFLVLRASLDKRMARTESVMGTSLFRSVFRSASAFLCASSLSALGALFVVGLLSSRLGSMKIVEFMGIKAQQGGAIVLIAAIFYLEISSRGGLRAARERVRRRVAELWSQPLVVGGFVVFVVSLVVLGMLLARSGNDPGVGVSTVELQFRAILEKLMGVRPRTKEFMIGHPALLLGIALMSMRRVRWGLPLLILGAIGQVSIVNTFCHLHTPLYVSFFRVFNGLWTGFVVALVVAWISDRFRAPRTA